MVIDDESVELPFSAGKKLSELGFKEVPGGYVLRINNRPLIITDMEADCIENDVELDQMINARGKAAVSRHKYIDTIPLRELGRILAEAYSTYGKDWEEVAKSAALELEAIISTKPQGTALVIFGHDEVKSCWDKIDSGPTEKPE